MKKLIGTAFVALALVGSASSAFAYPQHEPVQQQSQLAQELAFWAQFARD